MSSARVTHLLMSGAVAAAMMIGAGPAGAESLSDALVQAYQTSPLLDSNRAALRGLDEGVPQAKANKRPQVSASVSGTATAQLESSGRDIDNLQAALNTSLLLYDNGQTRAAIEAARLRIAAGRASLTDVEQLVLFNAVQAYADVRRDMEFVRLARNDVDRLMETLDATQNRFDVGEVTRTDVAQSQSFLAASRSALASAQGALEVSRQAYKAAVGMLPIDLQPLPPLPALPASLDEATALGVQRNPQVNSAQFSERAAVYDFERALAAKGPTVSANASVGVERGNQQSLRWNGSTFGQVGITGALPLYTGGLNDSLVRQAQALVDQRRFEVQDTARTVTQSVAQSWSQVEVARASIVALREQARAARIAAEGVSEEARLGARSTLDVLDSDQTLLQAQANIVSAVRDEYVAAYGLLQSMGLLTVRHLNLGIATYDPDVNFTRVQSGRPGGYDTSAVDRIRARWNRN